MSKHANAYHAPNEPDIKNATPHHTPANFDSITTHQHNTTGPNLVPWAEDETNRGTAGLNATFVKNTKTHPADADASGLKK